MQVESLFINNRAQMSWSRWRTEFQAIQRTRRNEEVCEQLYRMQKLRRVFHGLKITLNRGLKFQHIRRENLELNVRQFFTMWLILTSQKIKERCQLSSSDRNNDAGLNTAFQQNSQNTLNSSSRQNSLQNFAAEIDQNYPEDELYYQQEDHHDYNDPENVCEQE